MKIALFGARSDNSGLGNQTKEFFDHIRPAKTLVIDISDYTHKETFEGRFPGSQELKGFPDKKFINKWIAEAVKEEIELIFCCEIPYDYYLFEAAKKAGIPTALQYNYEFLDYLQTPTLAYPTILYAPSMWYFKEARDAMKGKCPVDFLPVPINTAILPRRIPEKIKTFVHIAGYPLYEDRNGTLAVLQAIPLVEEDIKVIVYAQSDPLQGLDIQLDPRIELRIGNVKQYTDLYKEADALLLPRRYGGLSLQCNEAMASGIPVIMPMVRPNNLLLHPDCLFEAKDFKMIKTRSEIRCWNINPALLAEKIEYFADAVPETISDISISNATMADQLSWESMLPIYQQKFEYLCGIPIAS